MRSEQAGGRTFFPFAAWSVAIGIAVPLSLEAIWWSHNNGWIHVQHSLQLQRLTLVLWPSSFLLLGRAWFLLPISVFTNAALYLVIGTMLWFGITKHKAILVVPVALLAGVWWRLLTL